MNILLSAVIGFCLVTAIVAESQGLDELEILEDLLLRKIERAAKQAAAETSATKSKVAEVAKYVEPALTKEEKNAIDAEDKSHEAENCPKEEEEEEEKKTGENEKIPISNQCCIDENISIDLTDGTKRKLTTTGMDIYGYVLPGSQRTECSARAWVQVKFESSAGCVDGCVKTPLCGRKMLKIELELAPRNGRSGHMLNIGDSVSNNGWGGDYSHQLCDAELHGKFPHIFAYNSDKCKSHPAGIFYNVLSRANRKLTLYVSNEYVLLKEENGQEHTICSHCLFCLAGQPDNNPNQDIYIGFNRIVHGTYRYGAGICSATLSWECPDCQWP